MLGTNNQFDFQHLEGSGVDAASMKAKYAWEMESWSLYFWGHDEVRKRRRGSRWRNMVWEALGSPLSILAEQ